MMTSKKRVLIVDDEPGFTRLLKLNLHQTGRYTAEVVNVAAEAVEVARAALGQSQASIVANQALLRQRRSEEQRDHPDTPHAARSASVSSSAITPPTHSNRSSNVPRLT